MVLLFVAYRSCRQASAALGQPALAKGIPPCIYHAKTLAGLIHFSDIR
jgi:hypothetical protein